MTTTSRPPLPDAPEELTGSVQTAFEAPEWYFDRLNYRIQLRRKAVRQWTRNLGFERCLDIGCGDGSVSLQLLQAGRSLTLQDLSDAMLERARRSIPPSFENCVKTVGGDFLQAVLPPKAYDIVICLGVLSYIMDLNAFLAKVASLVAPRGHLIIECTDGAHFLSKLWAAYSRLTGLVRKPAVRIALQAHAARTVGRTLRNRGFALAGTYRYSAPPPVIRRFFGQRFHSGVNQILHGDAAHNRLAWLGAECIFHFQQTAAAQIQPDGGHE